LMNRLYVASKLAEAATARGAEDGG
ncbi:MAG: hypothetical protein JWN43_2365, partial [Gammaproteobacteria bacterium]|nr:hypothetical protein [Gammaproteobacteria bacterium]